MALKRTALACIAALAVLAAQAQTCTSPNTDGDYILGTAEGAASAMHWDTGLVWKRCIEGRGFASGQCTLLTGSPGGTWVHWAGQWLPKPFSGQANFHISDSLQQNLLESGGWRMAYKTELMRIAVNCDNDPRGNRSVFPGMPSEVVWSASPDANSYDMAYGVNFRSGHESYNPLINATYALLVRGGQPFAAVAAPAARAATAGAQETFPSVTLAPHVAGGHAWGGARIAGEGEPEFQVNGSGAWVTEAIVTSGDQIAVRMRFTAGAGSTRTATLTVRSGQTTGTSDGAANGGSEATVMRQTQAAFTLGAPHPIGTIVRPLGTGSVTCAPNPVPHGGTAVCQAASSAYPFKAWQGGGCAGQPATCTLANVTGALVETAEFDTTRFIARPLNDTGTLACDANRPTAQDCHHGRDAGAATGQLAKTGASADARNGFDFTPLGAPWACTRDNVTGLVWEVKTGTGLHGQNHTYTWFDPHSPDGAPGVQCTGAAPCDTAQYVAAANAAALCGANDWRLPTLQELETLVDLGRSGAEPRIDPANFPAYVPGTAAAPYWTRTPFAGSTAQAWALDFATGAPRPAPRADALRVRLVRGGQ